MAQDNHITVTVVVSGTRIPVTANDHQKVEHLMREALGEAGQRGADLARWDLRFEGGGDPIPPNARISAVGIAGGMTLFLDPDEGGGGNASPSAGTASP